VVVKITDQCPASGNAQWCSGDIPHFDLSQAAFAAIASTTAGVVKTQFRRTSCLYTTNIRIVQEGSNQWYMKLRVVDVANYGGLSKVEIANKGATTFYAMAQSQDNGWVYQYNPGYVLPLTVRITDNNGQVLTLTNVITSIGNGVASTSTSNYKNTAAEETTTEPTPFMKFGIYVIVILVVVIILIGAIALMLRSKARERGTTVSDYVRGSIAPQHQELSLAPVPTSPMSSASDLGTSPPAAEEQTYGTNVLTAEPVPPQEWEQRLDATTGQNYYYNNSTGVTQWEVPDGVQA